MGYIAGGEHSLTLRRPGGGRRGGGRRPPAGRGGRGGRRDTTTPADASGDCWMLNDSVPGADRAAAGRCLTRADPRPCAPAWPTGRAYTNTGLRSSGLQPERLGEGSAPQRAAAGLDSARHIVNNIVHNIVEDQYLKQYCVHCQRNLSLFHLLLINTTIL